MSEGTVTIPVEEYNRLRDFEKAAYGKDYFIVVRSYHPDLGPQDFYSTTKDEIVAALKKQYEAEIKGLKRKIESTEGSLIMCHAQNKLNSIPWYKRLFQ